MIREVAVDDLLARCRALEGSGSRMQLAYAWFPQGDDRPELRYIVNPGRDTDFDIWCVRPQPGQTVPSLTPLVPLLSWYEREITDLCGLQFSDHPQPQPLVLLPGAQASRPPLQPGAKEPLRYTPQLSWMPEMAGRDGGNVQRLPFGPIRAGVVESAQFIYYYIGEGILHYHPQLFFKHRGMEQRFENVTPELGTVLAERVSGVGSVAHALAYCQALEAAAGCIVPERAAWLRALLAELERLYNHLHYLGHLADTTSLKAAAAEGALLSERAKQINSRVSGSRFLRSLICPGGLRREPDVRDLSDRIEQMRVQIAPYTRMLEASTTHLDRLITTGLLDRQTAFDQGATGPIERASGLDRDLRRDHPYAAYAELPLEVPVRDAGDGNARQQIRIAEIHNSLRMLQRTLLMLPEGPIRVECKPAPGSEGLGWAESPRGSLFYAVHIGADGRLARVKIKSPSFSNWRAFPFTVHDSNMMDYAINEASFGLTVAGCDR